MKDPIQKSFEEWKSWTLKRSLEVQPESRSDYSTQSGVPLERVYLPDESQEDYSKNIGFPGDYPFTRGVQPTMYRSRYWTMRQYAGYASAEETNKRFRFLLDQGQTGLSVAFDLPTQIGYDADDPLAAGEVGKVGVSISSLHDMELLFNEIPLNRISTSMTINAPAAILLAMYIAVAKRQGVDPRSLRGTIQNDILKEYISRGTYIFPPEPAMRLITDVFSYSSEEVPKWNTISISGYHMREAGATAVQEIAFTLANAKEYVRAAVNAGLPVDQFAPRLAFFFNAHSDFLEEIAKFRAARRMWARIMAEEFKATNPKACRLRFHTQTAGSTLTAQQPENNAVRVALQALAAVLGGTQSLHTNSMDEALGLPTESAVKLALRTQQVIAYETGAVNSVDPLAGSFLVERLTNELEKRAREYLAAIDELGGAVKAVETGYIHREIQESAYRTQMAIERGEQAIVGVNKYTSGEATPLEVLRVDPAIEAAQRVRLEKVRANRDSQTVETCLQNLADSADGDANLMPLFITCVEADVTLGEICHTLRKVWGEYQPVITI
jgi:methylmalonyl-CoA mutase N-terminal domain/subunit